MVLTLAFLLLGIVSSSFASLSCLDGNGSPIDWFVALKQPNGYDYQLFNGSSFQAAGSLETASGPVGLTLKTLYGCGTSCAYAMYNDESPDGKVSDSRAHMKGVIAFDGKSGFWLVHSVPKYPNFVASGYSYPESGTKYGQSFLCITLGTYSFDTIGIALQIDYPLFYDSQIPSSLQNYAPNFVAAVNGQHVKGSANNVSSIYSKGGVQFDIFAKNKDWNDELYEDLVAQKYNTGLQVETWQNGVGKLPSYCTPSYSYNVVNIQGIQMPDGTSWKETDDHSKWAISNSGKYACVGDINRVSGQFKRGGGTVCTQNSQLWGAFSSIISSVDSC